MAISGQDRAIYGARKAHAQVHTNPAVERVVERRLVVREVKVGKEAERAKRERKHRRHNPLEEPRSEEHGPVAAERDDEVEQVGALTAHVRGPVSQLAWLCRVVAIGRGRGRGSREVAGGAPARERREQFRMVALDTRGVETTRVAQLSVDVTTSTVRAAVPCDECGCLTQ